MLARPWVRLWRALPLEPAARWPAASQRARGAAPLRAVARWLGRPAPALAAFILTLAAWHLPGTFDATLRSGLLHVLEHTMFFATSMLLFKHVIHSPPLRAPLTIRRASCTWRRR